MKVPNGVTVYGKAKKKYSAGDELPAELDHLVEKVINKPSKTEKKEQNVSTSSNRTGLENKS